MEKAIFFAHPMIWCTFGRVGKRFVLTLVVKINRIRNQDWNMERTIVFMWLFFSTPLWSLS